MDRPESSVGGPPGEALARRWVGAKSRKPDGGNSDETSPDWPAGRLAWAYESQPSTVAALSGVQIEKTVPVSVAPSESCVWHATALASHSARHAHRALHCTSATTRMRMEPAPRCTVGL